MHTTEPLQWKIKKRPAESTAEFKVPKRVSQDPKSAPTVKMSQASWPGEAMEHNFYEEEPPLDDVAIPSSYIDDHHSDSECDEDLEAAKSLDREIKKLEQQKLKLLGSQRRPQGGHLASGQYSRGTSHHLPGHGDNRRTEESEQRGHRRAVEREQQSEAPEREHRGLKRYTVEVDMKGHPCGQNRALWLTCLRGHSADVDFSVDNYHNHSTMMLLSVKQRVDNTFAYEGGLGRVTEEAFHSELKTQLKSKRYQMKKALVAGDIRPKHIRLDHWVNLSKLIAEDRKVKEAEKLRGNRSNFRKPSTSRKESDEGAANLMEQRGSRYESTSPCSRQSKMVPDRDIYRRMEGLEENMKLILAALKIDHVGSAPSPTVEPVARAASSSTENMDNRSGNDSGAEKMKVDLSSGDVISSQKVSHPSKTYD